MVISGGPKPEVQVFCKIVSGREFKETIGRIGIPGLWTFGRPYNLGGTGLGIKRNRFFRGSFTIYLLPLIAARTLSLNLEKLKLSH